MCKYLGLPLQIVFPNRMLKENTSSFPIFSLNDCKLLPGQRSRSLWKWYNLTSTLFYSCCCLLLHNNLHGNSRTGNKYFALFTTLRMVDLWIALLNTLPIQSGTSLMCQLCLALLFQHDTLTYPISPLTWSSHIVDRLLCTISFYSKFSKSKHLIWLRLRCKNLKT